MAVLVERELDWLTALSIDCLHNAGDAIDALVEREPRDLELVDAELHHVLDPRAIRHVRQVGDHEGPHQGLAEPASLGVQQFAHNQTMTSEGQILGNSDPRDSPPLGQHDRDRDSTDRDGVLCRLRVHRPRGLHLDDSRRRDDLVRVDIQGDVFTHARRLGSLVGPIPADAIVHPFCVSPMVTLPKIVGPD